MIEHRHMKIICYVLDMYLFLFRYVQIGLVSKGIECGHPDYPGVYTRVTEVLNWIQSIAVQSLDSNCVAPRQGRNNNCNLGYYDLDQDI